MHFKRHSLSLKEDGLSCTKQSNFGKWERESASQRVHTESWQQLSSFISRKLSLWGYFDLNCGSIMDWKITQQKVGNN